MTLPPRAQLLHLVGGFILTQTIAALVRLGVADLVAERPRSAAELAEAVGADPDALRRALRALASVGVFAEEDGVVRHTELSELLRSDVPESAAGQALLLSGIHYRTWSASSGLDFRCSSPSREGWPILRVSCA